MSASGVTVSKSVFMYSPAVSSPSPWYTAFSTTWRVMIPATSPPRTTGTALMLERASMRYTSYTVLSADAVRGGDTISSAAVRRGITFSASTFRIRSLAWKMVASFMVAEAAYGCPPPPNSRITAPASTSGLRLRPTRTTRSPIWQATNRT